MSDEYANPEFEVIFFSKDDVFATASTPPTQGEDEGEFDLASIVDVSDS